MDRNTTSNGLIAAACPSRSSRRPIATSLLMIGILFVGLVAYPKLPVAPLPQVDFPTIQVSAALPGASPETMASSVAQPLERQFAQIPGVAQTTSSSGLGTTTVVVQFDLDRNIDAAANDIQAAINAASGQLPSDLPSPPTYRKVNPADSPILILSATSDTLPLTEVDDNADTKLAQQISQIDGVGQVSIGGEQKPAVRVQLDPAKLVAKNLSLEDVRAPLAVTTVNHAERQHRRRRAQLHDLRQRSAHRSPTPGTTSSSPIATARRCACATSARPSPARRTPRRRPGRRASAASSSSSSSSPAPTSSRPSTASRPSCRGCAPPCRRRSRSTILSDRTQTIRASVEDVQFTLLLTIALVVAVIFVFLRSLLGDRHSERDRAARRCSARAALMYLMGYSLDNLSLMALTISVGFVVDDAIVMLENIVRHIEDGMKPFEAALKGAREIAFTILSISLSLVAVFIPLLLHGRHHRPPVPRVRRHRHHVHRGIGVRRADADADDGVALPHAARRRRGTAGFYALTERGFDRLLRAYERCLDVVLRHQFRDAVRVPRDAWPPPCYLFIAIPKGFFPQQDTGLITGTSEAAQDVSFAEMMRRQEALGEIIGKDPDVATYAMAIGAGGSIAALNNGRFFITLKPRSEREGLGRRRSSRACAPQLEKVEGAKLFLQAAQDVNVGGRAGAHRNSSTRCRTPTSTSSMHGRRRSSTSSRPCRSCATWRPTSRASGTTLTLTIDRDQASRYGLDAAADRRHALRRVRPAPDRPVLHAAEQLPRGHGDAARAAGTRRQPRQDLHQVADSRSSRSRSPPSPPGRRARPRPCRSRHQGQFPAVTISFNLAQGGSLGTATQAIQAGRARAAASARACARASRATHRPSRIRCRQCRC